MYARQKRGQDFATGHYSTYSEERWRRSKLSIGTVAERGRRTSRNPLPKRAANAQYNQRNYTPRRRQPSEAGQAPAFCPHSLLWQLEILESRGLPEDDKLARRYAKDLLKRAERSGLDGQVIATVIGDGW